MENKTINFQIKAIEILDSEIKHPGVQLPPQITYNFNLSLDLQINLDNKLVIVITTVNVLREDKKTQLALLKASCIFEVTNLNDFFNKETNEVLFPEEIMTTLNSISISTMRGIMFSQFKGTFLHNAVLPVIDPKSFVKNS